MVDWRQLRQCRLFGQCSEDDLSAVCSLFSTVYKNKLESVYEEGRAVDSIYFVVRGRVELTREIVPEMQYFRLAVIEQGEVFGIGELMLDRYYTSARALDRCTLLAIRAGDFLDTCLGLDNIKQDIIRDYNNMIRILVLKVVHGAGVNELALYLYHVCRDFGREEGRFIKVSQKQFQPRIASILNMSREHVTRLFSQLKTQGAVDFNKGFPLVSRGWLDDLIRDKEYADSIIYRYS